MTNEKGIYVLIVEVSENVQVGKLGHFKLDGRYLYVGSALGPGGFKRVDRHIRVAQGIKRTRRWHIDYLLEAGRLEAAIVARTERKIECELAAILSKKAALAVSRFGAGDCKCETHLFKTELSEGRKIVGESIKKCGLNPKDYLSDDYV